MAKHIVLVHGAWQGGWSFDLIKPLLEQTGWQVHAVDLPGNGWNSDTQLSANQDNYCDFVVQTIQKLVNLSYCSDIVAGLNHFSSGRTNSRFNFKSHLFSWHDAALKHVISGF